jgi:hypothetical protein
MLNGAVSKWVILCVAACLVGCCGVDLGLGATEPHMEILPEEIVGVALFPDGETPIVDLPVRVWDIDENRMIYRDRTDEDGVFRIPEIGAERCYIFVGRVKIDLRVMMEDEDALWQHHDIVVVMPKKMLMVRQIRLLDVLIAPALMRPPDDDGYVSP